MSVREGTAGDGPRVDHHELARRRQQGRDEHQQKHRVDAVATDEGGDRGDLQPGTRLYFFFFGFGFGLGGGGGGTRRTVKVVSNATDPISLVAVTSAT